MINLIDHFEVIEREIIKRLDELGFSGIILLDDIHHPAPKERDAMQRLWNGLDYELTILRKEEEAAALSG